MNKTMDFINGCGIYYIATNEGDQPRVRPFGGLCEFEGKVYFATNNRKEVYKQMLANPKVEICAFKDADWVRLAGEVKLDERREARAAMMEACPSLGNMYNIDDNLMVVFYFVKGIATRYSFTGGDPVTCDLYE